VRELGLGWNSIFAECRSVVVSRDYKRSTNPDDVIRDLLLLLLTIHLPSIEGGAAVPHVVVDVTTALNIEKDSCQQMSESSYI